MRTDYDRIYQDPSYFNYRPWMFAPYVRALVKKYNVRKRSRLLDLGCGTGFFAQLFCDEGMDVIGIDLSEVGVRAARTLCKGEIHLVVGDGNELPFKAESFDLIFCRGYVPYNLENLASHTQVTRYLLRYLRAGGLFVFAYSTDLSGLLGRRKRPVGKTGSSWINQTLDDIEQHFSSIESARVVDLCFLNRLEPVFLGRYGMNSLFNPINAFLVKATGVRGEAICVLEKCSNGC